MAKQEITNKHDATDSSGVKTNILSLQSIHLKFPLTNSLFSRSKSFLHVLNNVNLDLQAGETLGLVGESGCGKSTLAHAVVQLHAPYAGKILYNGENILEKKGAEALRIKKNIQIVFQDPYTSLNPRMTVGNIIAEPLVVYRKHGLLEVRDHEIKKKISEVLERVGLTESAQYRYPHNFSGGQRQRISIARALILEPRVLLADESVSALDVSIQAQIVNLLKELQKDLGLAMLFISHDLAVVRHISDRVAIMYCGKIVEQGVTSQIYSNPMHPYTKALLSAVNEPDPRIKTKRILLEGGVPSLREFPEYCPFSDRCPSVKSVCRDSVPLLKPPKGFGAGNNNHDVACYLYE